MSKIEAAVMGTVCGVPKLKTSAKGAPWLSFSMRCGDGTDASFAQVAVFENVAEFAGRLEKGMTIYVEGALTLSTWQTAQGEHKAGLNIAARYVRLPEIGRNRPPRQKTERPTSPRADRYAGENRPPFDDQLPI
jgi:single-stranded DNA-binding protein